VLAPADALAHLRLAVEVAGMGVDELATPVERDVVVDGIRLHYLDWGAVGRPPLLFLHGGCLTAHTWDLVSLALRNDFHCLALDQRGHGESEWSPVLDYSPEAHARDIAGLIARLGLARPVLIGHSLGGLNAMTYAIVAAEELGGVVLVDVVPEVRANAVRRIADFATAEPAQGTLEQFVLRARGFNPRRDPRLLRYSLLHNLRELPDGRLTWKYDVRALTPGYLKSIKSRLERLPDFTEAVTCPVLIVRGGESEASSDEAAARFAATFQNGRWAKVEDAGHTVQGDNPRDLARVLSGFLAEIGSG
jgi:pimeloyl-ACP methyl ester carboxylesterase